MLHSRIPSSNKLTKIASNAKGPGLSDNWPIGISPDVVEIGQPDV